MSFAGQRARSNNITVDGLNNNDPVLGSVRATFSQEAVREFQVLTNSYAPEFGKATGGVLNIVTKSGANEVRGNAFFFARDRALNARGRFEQVDPFGEPVDVEKAPYSQEQTGPRSAAAAPQPDVLLPVVRASRRRRQQPRDIDDRAVIRHPFLGTPLARRPASSRRRLPVETGNVP